MIFPNRLLTAHCALALVAGGIVAAGAVFAQSPGWAGPDVGEKSEERQARENDKSAITRAQQKAGEQPKAGADQKDQRRDEQKAAPRDDQKSERRDGGPAAGQRGQFDDRHRLMVRDYYEENYHGDRCPPGLAKKPAGCMPPGQAKRWQYGHPLARDVVYYEVPQPLIVQIGAPPRGYRYVRVATDILLIAIGTGMVVDAIEDLGRS